MIQVIERTVIGENLSVEFVHQGRGAGDPIVFLHGVTDSWRSFEPVLSVLSPDVEAYAFSQRGHGDSDRPSSGYQLKVLAGDVAAFMRSLGIERAVIVGHSMGAIVAQQFALDFPNLVSGLVLIGSMSNLAGNADVQLFYDEAIDWLDGDVSAEMARDFQESTVVVPVDPALIEMMITECLKAPARVWKAAFQGFKDVNLLPALPNVTTPVLLLWGSLDNFSSRAEQDATAAALRSSRLVVFEGYGHSVHWEAPGLIADEIERFVASL